MARFVLAAGLILWAGATLCLSTLRWFNRASLADRLHPYALVGVRPGAAAGPSTGSRDSGLLGPPPGSSRRQSATGVLDEVFGPFARAWGERVARAAGVAEDLETRLHRVHSPLDVTSFRVRQVGWSIGAFLGGAVVSTTVRSPLAMTMLFVVASPLLAFLVHEQRVAAASARWQRRVFLELPVVAEQLAMLLEAGYSLAGSLERLARRGRGACARDLARVCARMRQGLTEGEALAEWAAGARVDAVDRLVSVLALSREGAGLGRLLSEEARAIRRDVQRELIETAERRGQQVWIPVTVAALLPGAMFIAIPFLEALRLFAQ
jgi:tight adherence protein C